MARNGANEAAAAIVWQTGSMRGDLQLYVCSLHLNFTTRKLNLLEWYYIPVVNVDANGSPGYVTKGIACIERHNA